MTQLQKFIVSVIVISALIGIFAADKLIRKPLINSVLNKNTVTQLPMSPTTVPTPAPKRKTYSQAPKLTIDKNKKYTAVLKTSKGNMKIEFFAKEDPMTVNNFIFLAQDGFYDQTVFHRIIQDFMVQGGDPMGDGTGGPDYKFDDEKITRKYLRGTLAMANSGPNTNGSQFFIVHKDYPLDAKYTIFGRINPMDEESLKTLDAIASTPVKSNNFGELSSPQDPVYLTSIIIASN